MSLDSTNATFGDITPDNVHPEAPTGSPVGNEFGATEGTKAEGETLTSNRDAKRPQENPKPCSCETCRRREYED